MKRNIFLPLRRLQRNLYPQTLTVPPSSPLLSTPNTRHCSFASPRPTSAFRNDSFSISFSKMPCRSQGLAGSPHAVKTRVGSPHHADWVRKFWVRNVNFSLQKRNRFAGGGFLRQMNGRRSYMSSTEVAFALIGTNVAVYFLWQYADAAFMGKHFMISMKNVTKGRVHTMITSAFSHMDTDHLIKNMLALYFFGSSIGNYFGPRFLLEMYIAGAFTGSIFYLANAFLSARSLKGMESKVCLNYPGLGASGAVNAILLFYILCFPNSTIYFHFLVPVPAALVGAIVVGTDLWRVKQGDKHVSGSCHLGGAFAACLVYAKYIKHWI